MGRFVIALRIVHWREVCSFPRDFIAQHRSRLWQALLARELWLRMQPPTRSRPPSLLQLPSPSPATIALPLPEDRGQAALEQTLKRLGTTASVMMIVAHPDDEDGALLTYLSRGLGVRVTLLTLTRGEGGQNAMSRRQLTTRWA